MRRYNGQSLPGEADDAERFFEDLVGRRRLAMAPDEAENAERFFEDLVGRGRHAMGQDSTEGVSEPAFVEDGGDWRAAADRFFADLTGEPLPDRWPASQPGTAPLRRRGPSQALQAGEDVRPAGSLPLVRWVQETLNRVVRSALSTDGVLGPRTAAALSEYQAQRGLPVERRLLGRTLRALAADSGTVPPGVWAAAPLHRGRSPDLTVPCPGPATLLDGFAFGLAAPTAEHRALLQRIAAEIAASQSSSEPVHLVCLDGHTDDVGDDASNERLGQRRADAIAAELARALDRASPGLSRRVGVWRTTAGETQPVAPNDSPENRARNRRVVLVRNGKWRDTAVDGDTLTVTLLDDRGELAAAGTPYRVRVGAIVREGRLGESGRLVEARLPLAGVDSVFLEYGRRTQWIYGNPPPRTEVAIARAAAPRGEDLLTEGDPPGDITRWQIFVPVDDAAMQREAGVDIDPLTLPPVEPSWRVDGLALLSTSDPGHFIARKMAQIPRDEGRPFDTRVYYCHPLNHRFYGYPAAASPPPPSPPGSSAVPTDLARSQNVPVAPSPAQPGAKQGTAGGSPWYNQKPSRRVPLMGQTAPPTTSDARFQRLLTAVNKRLVKTWMGELKRHLGNRGDLPKLVAWFGDPDGRAHFKQWCQAQGTQGGDRGSPKSAHGKGRAIDMNYDYNPWVPLCDATGRTMVGEDHSRNQGGIDEYQRHFGDPAKVYAACGRIYDRALRLFVPLTIADTDPNGTRYFSSRYFRNHHDWTPSRTPADSPPFTAEQVFGFYQILSWSVRFYFDYAYQQCAIAGTSGNVYSTHAAPDPLAVWKRIEDDWTSGRLPTSAELHVTNRKAIPAAQRAFFDEVDMSYSFQRDSVKVSRFRLAAQMDRIATDDLRRAMGDILVKQLAADHEMLSRGMVTTVPGRRDPCNGVFNHCFDVFLAFCYMLSEPDSRWLRAFGAFAAGAGGDMQHFDYRHARR